MKIGIILPHLLPSQLSFEVFNIINANQGKNEYIIFYENASPILNPPLCPIMNLTEIKHFSGRLVGFSLSSADYMLKTIKKVENLLYLYDLDWLRGKNDYITNVRTLAKLKLYTRSDEYAKLISNYSNSPCEFKPIEELLC